MPIRIRLTLGFALVMAVLLLGSGLYMRSRVEADLNAGIDHGLDARVVDLTALVKQSESGLGEAKAGPSEADFAQIVTTSGHVLDASGGVKRSFLSAAQLQTALKHSLRISSEELPGLETPVRILAKPVNAQDRRLVVVAATSLDSRNRALDRVTAVMLFGGPALLLLASLAGYGLAALALRPVERMRVRAEGIWSHGLHERLPRTGANDELDRLAATLNASLDRVESSLEREHGFVADASHELRTPLTVLRAQLELLAGDPDRSEAHRRAELSSAVEEVDRLSELADHLLLLARADRGELAVPATSFAVGPLLERVGSRAALLGTGPVEVPEPDEALWLAGSEPRIEQALLNLIENALAHGDGSARIEVRPAGDLVELHVLDDGPGFPPGFTGAAFDRFSRGERARSGDGAGLGLAIVREIAEAHGGSTGAANRPDGGADVWISLPRAPAGVQAPRNVRAQSSAGR